MLPQLGVLLMHFIIFTFDLNLNIIFIIFSKESALVVPMALKAVLSML